MSVRSHTHCSPPRNRSMMPSRVGSASARNSAAARSRSLSVAVATAVNISRFLDQSSPDYTAPTTLAAMQVLIARHAGELAAIAEGGGLDVVMLGLGPNAHLASNEPGCAFDLRTRPVRLLDETVRYILSDDVIQGPVCDRAVTLGLATIIAAREVVVLVSGQAKREPLARALDGPVTPEVPASILRTHPRCLVIADRAARP